MDKIAVTGISLQFPGSANYAQFWQSLLKGDDVRSFFPKERLRLILNSKKEIWEKYHDAFDRVQSEQGIIPGYYLNNIDLFDADFFQIPPAEAALMDPRHRLFLMLVWEALQDAGYTRKTIQNTEAGVFLGYAPKWDQEYVRFFSEEEPTQIEGNNTPNCAARPSYWLNLGGPVITVNTTCSSSLVACHLGVQSLVRKECSLAIVGGVQCSIFPFWDKEPDIGIESVDNCCKTFDIEANGTAFGDGIAVMILKRLDDALAVGDPIHAVIRGSAVNSDGRSNGLSAPNPKAQVALIQKALREAQLSPDDIGYFEAHGTGTKLGDPIEVDALCKVVKKNKHAPYIGSVKPNIGHLGDSAGLGGAIKAILCLKHKKIPQQIHFNKLNPHLQKAEKYLSIPTKNQTWELTGKQVLRRAGVSSFGVSGTNAHVIIEESPLAVDDSSIDSCIHLPLTLSGPAPASLWDYLQQLRDFLEAHPETRLCDLTYTSNFHREHFPHRICIWADSLSSLKKKVDQLADWREFEEFPKRFFSQGVWTSVYPTPPRNMEITNEMALAKDYVGGGVVEFKGLYKNVSPNRIFMPYAPLNLKSYWPESENSAPVSMSDLFYDFAWEEKLSSIPHDVDASPCLLFSDSSPFTNRVITQLAQFGKKAILVSAGREFNRLSSSEWTIRANHPEDYLELIKQIRAEYQNSLKEILHLWTYLPPEKDALNLEEIKKIKELSLFSLFHLSRALVECLPTQDLRLNFISSYGKKFKALIESNL